jgi:hypothetical protein
MGKTIAIGLMAAALYAAPLRAEPANSVSPSILKPNNDASLRAPHAPPPWRRHIAPKTDSAPTDQQR